MNRTIYFFLDVKTFFISNKLKVISLILNAESVLALYLLLPSLEGQKLEVPGMPFHFTITITNREVVEIETLYEQCCKHS